MTSINYMKINRVCKVFCRFVRVNVVLCKGITDLRLTGMSMACTKSCMQITIYCTENVIDFIVQKLIDFFGKKL